MNREFYKTALLNILVFLSIILAFNIWFDKELWSAGYNSFVHSIENIFPFLSDDVYIENSILSSESEFGMEWITISGNNNKSIIYFGDGKFKTFKNEIEYIKSTVTKAGTVSEISDEDFTNIFKSGSIAVKFNTPVSLKKYFDRNSQYFDGMSPVSQLLLFTTSSDNESIRYLYFTDSKTNTAYRMPVKYNNGNLISLISQNTTSIVGSDSYAFELNFHKETQGVSRILFDSFVPITTQTKSIFKTVVKPVHYNSANTFDGVFKAFNIKKNSARSYKDTDNFINYMENYASLRIRDDGYFIYETDAYQKGVLIGKGSTTTDVIRFVNSLYREIVNSDSILILKSINEKPNNETEYGFVYSDTNTNLYTDDAFGVKVTVKEGYIFKYSQYVLKLEKSNDAFVTGSVIEAYDSLYNSGLWQEKKNQKIRQLIPVNYYDNNEVTMKWYVEFSDGTFNFL